MAAIEVEKKFYVHKGIENTLEELKATLKCKKCLCDIYYDSEDNKITLSDFWLRKRNETWELKYPPKTKLTSSSTQYVETASTDQIISLITTLLNLSTVDKEKINSVEDLTEIAKLTPLVTLTTVRQSFQLGDCVIDLDTADFGYSIGEIEKVVTSEDMVEDALSDIDQLALKLGITPSHERVPGKIDVYLKQNNPKLYEKLIKKNILC